MKNDQPEQLPSKRRLRPAPHALLAEIYGRTGDFDSSCYKTASSCAANPMPICEMTR
jgi:hypothetical protein